jgi:hypothetical protein
VDRLKSSVAAEMDGVVMGGDGSVCIAQVTKLLDIHRAMTE